MAQIRKIIRENPLSNFTQVAPETGSGFKLLAEGLNVLNERVAPVAMDQMKARGDALGRDAAKAQFGDSRPYAPKTDAEQIGADTMSALGKDSPRISTSGGDDNWLKYSNSKAIRNKPISEKLKTSMSFLSDMGITMDVISGGETADRKASNSGRHMHGNSADVDFYKDGRKLVSGNAADEAVLSQIVAQAKANGVTGFGEGSDYMGAGRVHLGFGKEAVWGAGGKGENAPAWLKTAFYGSASGGGGGGPSAPRISTQSGAAPSVMIRASDGKLEAHMYSPYSGPLLQASNIAAQIGYQAEVLNKSDVDLQDMSNQFPLDPDGYKQAAKGYVDQLVENAPLAFRPELRKTLEKEIHQREMGLMVEKQRDVRARANNSSAALVDRWSQKYADALVSGDAATIESTRSQLDGVLQAREALPGVAWTTEQSANIFIKAQRSADIAAEKAVNARTKKTKSQFALITKAAKAGATAEGEELLLDPQAIADDPEGAREAAAFVSLRDNMPEFQELTPDEQAAAVARLAAEKVTEEWNLHIVDAAGKVAKESKRLWADDPVAQAQSVMKVNPPPPLPEPNMADPDKFVAGLEDRKEYMNALFEKGYTDTRSYFSKQEADAIKTMMGTETPPEIRAAISGAIVAGFGKDAVGVFDQISADPVTGFAGKMLALGGNPEVATAILRGQQMMKEGLVRVPTEAKRIEVFNTGVASAFAGVPGALEAQSEIMGAAQALYAADPEARTLDPTSDAAKALMSKSIQTALGQGKNGRGQITGGVQEIMGHNTLLPVGMVGEDVNKALLASVGTQQAAGLSLGLNGLTPSVGFSFGDTPVTPEKINDAWAAATARDGFEGSVPLFNGQPIPARYVDSGNVRLIPAGANGYRMEITSGIATMPAEDADGNILFFDLEKLVEAMQ